MVITLFFSTCMAFLAYFFIVAGNAGSVSSWLYAAFLVFLFVRIIHTNRISKYRRAFQVVFAVLFMISFIGILYDERGSMTIASNSVENAQIPFCQIVIPIVFIPYLLTKTIIFPARIIGHFASVISMLLVWVVSTVTIGRGWCSWVCFYGGWEDGASRLSKKTRVPLHSHNRDVRSFQFAFLAFIVLASLAVMSSVYCEWFCPFKLVTEYSPVSDIPSLIAAVLFIGLFLGLVIVMPFLTRKRFQCSAFCPFGAFQSLVDKASAWRVRIDTEKCIACMKCVKACPFMAIDPETITERKGRPEMTCAKCGECIDVCPQGAISYQFAFVKQRCAKPEPENRAERFVQKILDPQAMFVFSAFTLSVIISSKFAPNALDRIFSLFSGGAR